MSLTRLERLARDTDQPMRVREAAACQLVSSLLVIRVDGLLQHHEAGWTGICPMWSGVLPGGGSGEDEPIMVAARRLRQLSSAEDAAVLLLSRLTPRQRVAVLVDTWRDGKMTRAEACDPERWHQIICLLSLHRQPGIKPADYQCMGADALKMAVCRGRKVLERVLVTGIKEKAAA